VGTGRRIAAAAVGVVALLLVLAQLFLPGIAADHISSKLARYGHVQSVHVSAWPAIELLWGRADSVRVRASDLALAPSQGAHVVQEASGVHDLDMSAARVRVGPLALTEVKLRKHGAQLSATALAGDAAVAAALPPGVHVRLLRSERGAVEVGVGGTIFGVGGEIDAVARASGGKLIASPSAPLLRAFAITLFEDPHVYIEGIAASAAAEAPPARRYTLEMNARLE
jgi:LmeA-like phospholipid-binding